MKILVIGGNLFFGKKLVARLIESGHQITLLSRGNVDDGFADQVERIRVDRTDKMALRSAVQNRSWDVLYDQVCYDYITAKNACEIFEGSVGRYIFTSSQVVYGLHGESLAESDFIPDDHNFETYETQSSNYSEAKRQAEVGFWESAKFPLTCVRLPIVVGADDCTMRFQYHVRRVIQNEEIFFPNTEAELSFITSDFAADALAALSTIQCDGPINVANPAPIKLSRLIGLVEQVTGRSARLAQEGNKDNFSPYGFPYSWSMSCEKLRKLGVVGGDLEDLLPKLLHEVAAQIAH